MYGSEIYPKHINEDGYLLIKRDDQNSIIGFGMVQILEDKPNPHKVNSLYFGRAFDHPGQGIGQQILKEEHNLLRSRGITEYRAFVRGHSKKVYEKIGINSTVVGGDDSGSETLLVKL
jgi:hypothetical protein